MGLGRKLKDLLDIKGIKVSTLCDDLGLNRSSVYSLIQRDSDKMDMDTLSHVADYLNVSIDYFFLDGSSNISSIRAASPRPCLTANESELLTLYRSVNEVGQEHILSTARLVAGNPDIKQATPVGVR